MTVLKHVETWVTGSDLTPQLKKTRLHILLVVSCVLGCVLAFFALQNYSNTARFLDRARPGLNEFVKKQEKEVRIRLENLEQETKELILVDVRRDLIINQIIIWALLSFLLWLLLYGLLKPIALEGYKKETWLKHASHELRTPLAIVHSELQLLPQAPSLIEYGTIVETTKKQINYLVELSNSLLTTLENKSQVALSKEQLTRLVITSIDNHSTLGTVHIALKDQAIVMIPLHCNKKEIERIINNCIDNIQRYSLPQSKAVITISKNSINFWSLPIEPYSTTGTGLEIIQALCSSNNITYTSTHTAGSYSTTLTW